MSDYDRCTWPYRLGHMTDRQFAWGMIKILLAMFVTGVAAGTVLTLVILAIENKATPCDRCRTSTTYIVHDDDGNVHGMCKACMRSALGLYVPPVSRQQTDR